MLSGCRIETKRLRDYYIVSLDNSPSISLVRIKAEFGQLFTKQRSQATNLLGNIIGGIDSLDDFSGFVYV